MDTYLAWLLNDEVKEVVEDSTKRKADEYKLPRLKSIQEPRLKEE